MCRNVSIAEYREGWNGYTIEGEYVKPHTDPIQEGLIVKGIYGSLYNIYNAAGSDYEYFESLDEAQQNMLEHGFVIKSDAVALEQPAEQPVRVQGKTLDEWEAQGKLNESLPHEEHVHPVEPQGEATEDELTAFVNSLTDEEVVGAILVMGMEAQLAANAASQRTKRPRTRALRPQRASSVLN